MRRTFRTVRLAAAFAVGALGLSLLGAAPALAQQPGGSPSPSSVIVRSEGDDAAAGVEKAPDPRSLASTQHKPGKYDVREWVPSTLKMPDGSPHPCAGRFLLYRAHVDNVYVTHYHNKLTFMVVAGSTVFPADKVCLRLAPDSLDGRETSRLVLPANNKLDFLGEPGRIVWHAPYQDNSLHSPIWSGMGAFDPEHEYKIPEGVKKNKVTISLNEVRGPGRYNIFLYQPESGVARQIINSADPDYQQTEFGVGGHGHLDSSFTKEGIYHTMWGASMIYKDNRKEFTRDSVDVTWLVGTDEAVGLPRGFTKGVVPPRVTAEDMREQASLTDPHDDNDGIQGEKQEIGPKVGPPPQLGAKARAAVAENLKSAPSGFKTVQGAVNVTFEIDEAAAATNRWYDPQDANVKVGGKPLNASTVEVSDAPENLRCVPDPKGANRDLANMTPTGWIWDAAPAGSTSVTWDFTTLPEADTTKPVTVVNTFMASPSGGYVTFGNWQGQVWEVKDSNAAMVGNTWDAAVTSPVSGTLLFSQPGRYRLETDYNYTKTNGQKGYKTSRWEYLVGNEAINMGRAKYGAQPLEVNTRASQTCANLDAGTAPDAGDNTSGTDAGIPDQGGGETPDTGDTSTGGENGTDNANTSHNSGEANPASSGSNSGVANTETTVGDAAGTPTAQCPMGVEKQIRAAWANKVPTHLIHTGHMDLALGATKEPELHDSENPASPQDRASGDFAFTLPDTTRQQLPKNAHGLDEVRAQAPEGVWTVPEVQEFDRVWVGFSTQRVDYTNIKDQVINLTMKPVVMPAGGRVVTGTYSTFGVSTFNRFLDSADSSATLAMPPLTHKHAYSYFTAPGIYVLDYVYTWTENGKQQQRTLRASWLVGDEAVAAAQHIVANPTVDASCTQAPAAGGDTSGSGTENGTTTDVTNNTNNTGSTGGAGADVNAGTGNTGTTGQGQTGTAGNTGQGQSGNHGTTQPAGNAPALTGGATQAKPAPTGQQGGYTAATKPHTGVANNLQLVNGYGANHGVGSVGTQRILPVYNLVKGSYIELVDYGYTVAPGSNVQSFLAGAPAPVLPKPRRVLSAPSSGTSGGATAGTEANKPAAGASATPAPSKSPTPVVATTPAQDLMQEDAAKAGHGSGWGSAGWMSGLLLGAGGMAALIGLAALISALVLAARRRREEN